MRPLYATLLSIQIVVGALLAKGKPLRNPSVEVKKLGAKTKRKDGAVRTVAWSVRFATDECDQLREKAYRAHTSVSEYIRRTALGRKVIEPPPPPAVNIQTYRELSNIGNNLNQLVTAVNRAVLMGQDVNIDSEKLSLIVDGLQISIKEVRKQLLTVETGEDNQG